MRVHRNVAGGWLELARQNLHQSRFARAIGTDQAIALTIAETGRYVLEQRLGTELNRQIGSGDQCPGPGLRLAERAGAAG